MIARVIYELCYNKELYFKRIGFVRVNFYSIAQWSSKIFTTHGSLLRDEMRENMGIWCFTITISLVNLEQVSFSTVACERAWCVDTDLTASTVRPL